MKKIIACLMAISAVMCITAACGQVEEPADEISTSVASTELSENGELTEEQTESTSDETEETTEKAQELTSSYSSDLAYASAVEEYVSAVNSKDYEKVIELMFPDNLAEIMMEFDDYDIQQAADVFDGVNCTIVELRENSDATKEFAEELAQAYSQLKGAYEYMAENGEEAFWSYESDENARPVYKINELYEVTLTVADENGDTADVELMVYNVEGEGWNVDASLKGYIAASKNQSMNRDAKTFYQYANTVLVELDCMGVDLTGNFVICSDSSKNICGDFDADGFIKDLGNWFPDHTDYDYVLVIDDGVCIGAYCAYKSEPEVVGMYPQGIVPSYENGEIITDKNKISEDESYSLDELYKMITAQAE